MIEAVIFDYGGVIFRNLMWHNDMFDLARDIRAKGLRTAILSNMIPPVAWVIRRHPETKNFDPVVISCEVKHSKPKPEIYEIILGQLNLPAERCLFIDDRLANLETAKAMGMQTVHVTNPAVAIAKVRELLGMQNQASN